MDRAKCAALKERLLNDTDLQSALPIEEFLDGNDDLGSIGCNLTEHPGIDVFRDTLFRLKDRPDVEAVYVRIFEIDPGKDSWPFTDIVFVVGTIPDDDLDQLLQILEPDEIGDAEDFDIPEVITARHQSRILAAWWD